MDGNPFLIHDNNDNNNRIVVFGQENCLSHLCHSGTWYMDGTFIVVPALFQQLYVIRVPLDESAITTVYAFMLNKSEASYMELFQILTNKCRSLGMTLDPAIVTVDFEKAMMNTIVNYFGTRVVVKGCYFHLCQSSWRKIQELGLSQVYLNDDEIQCFCGMLDGLAFLPLNLVAAGVQYIKNNTPNGFEPLVQYFDETCVRNKP